MIELPDYLYRELTDAPLNTIRLITLFSALPLERNDILIKQCIQIYGLDPNTVIAQRLNGAERFDVRMAMLGKAKQSTISSTPSTVIMNTTAPEGCTESARGCSM